MLPYMTIKPVSPACVECAGCGGFVDGMFYPVFKGLDGKNYCKDCNPYVVCAGCGELHNQEDCKDSDGDSMSSARYLHVNRAGYCEECWDERYYICTDCGAAVDRDDYREVNDDPVCSDCRVFSDTWDIPTWRNPNGKFGRTGSKRSFGVEVETNDCSNHTELYDDRAWGCHHDCTCNGEEMVSAILNGDAGLSEVDRLMDFADNNGWEVGTNCGLHIHLDMRNENDGGLFSAACAYLSTYDVWNRLVESHRNRSNMCGACSADVDEFDNWRTFEDFSGSQTRYEWCNFAAYNEHNTFEIRLHHATLDGQAICNWIRAHTVFADWAVKQDCTSLHSKLGKMDTNGKFRLIAKIWTDAGCADLVDYYADKGGFKATEYTVSAETKRRINSLVSNRW